MSKPLCKNPTVCPLCAGPQAKAEHRCPNPTCPRGGNLKPVLNCCIASPARYPNCSEDHSAGYRDCMARPIPPPVVPPTSWRRRQPPLLPLTAHLSSPSASYLRPIQTLWTPNQMKQDPPLPLPHTPPPGLESPLEFATPKAPLRPALMDPSRSTTRTGRPHPDGELTPSPAPRDQSASRW